MTKIARRNRGEVSTKKQPHCSTMECTSEEKNNRNKSAHEALQIFKQQYTVCKGYRLFNAHLFPALKKTGVPFLSGYIDGAYTWV